jgi:hypothetical protein
VGFEMSETHEINLLRNVHAVDSRSSVSKEFVGLKRKQTKDSRKKRSGYAGKSNIARISHGGYVIEASEDEQESTIDITV